jgi:hypothetical protein
MAAQVSDEWLSWISELARISAMESNVAVRGPSEGFHCLLDEQPTHLVPDWLLRQAQFDHGGTKLCLNPDCRLGSKSDEDQDLESGRLLNLTVPTGGCTAWVRDSATGVKMPFALSPELSGIAREIVDRPARIANLPENLRTLFYRAQILISPESSHRQRTWSAVTQHCRAKFLQNGYAAVPGLIHPFHLGALRRYCRRQIRRGTFRLGDDQSSRRYIAHNDPVARFFHLQLAPFVSKLVGKSVKPSYVYLAAYQPGARLEKHTDREQCTFSVTLCVDYSPEPALATLWPLYLDTPRGSVSVYQALGDGLLYRGCELPHYRRTLAQGHTSTSIFFHYVAEDFAGSLD